MAQAGMPSCATRFASSSGRLAPSSSEYSVWRWRWTKDIGGCDILLDRAGGAHHHPISLHVRTEDEWLRTGVAETALEVEGNGAPVALPDRQPERAAAELPSCQLDFLHQQRRDAFPLPRPVDVEASERGDGRRIVQARAAE